MSAGSRYLYGDSTPFPLACNFLEILDAAVEVSVAMLQADVRIEKAERAMGVAATRATEDLEQLKGLHQAIEETLARFAPEGQAVNVCQETAARLRVGTRSAMAQVRAQVEAWRAAALQKAEESKQRDRLLADLQPLFVRYAFPESQWYVSWQSAGEDSASARAEIVTPIKLHLVLEVAIPETSPWRRPVRVGSLAPGLSLPVLREGWIRGSRRAMEPLERYAVTRVRATPTGGSVTVHKTLKEGAPGFEVVVEQGEAGAQVTLRGMAGEASVGEPQQLEGAEADAATALWRVVAEPVAALASHRARVVQAVCDGASVPKLERPGMVAQLLIAYTAPYCREIKARSSTSGELDLKREVEDGRREELFLKETVLINRIADLPESKRKPFEVLGLGEPDPATAEPLAAPVKKAVNEFDSLSNPEFDYEPMSNPDFSYEPMTAAELGIDSDKKGSDPPPLPPVTDPGAGSELDKALSQHDAAGSAADAPPQPGREVVPSRAAAITKPRLRIQEEQAAAAATVAAPAQQDEPEELPEGEALEDLAVSSLVEMSGGPDARASATSESEPQPEEPGPDKDQPSDSAS